MKLITHEEVEKMSVSEAETIIESNLKKAQIILNKNIFVSLMNKNEKKQFHEYEINAEIIKLLKNIRIN